jgi:DNA repair photolyase
MAKDTQLSCGKEDNIMDSITRKSMLYKTGVEYGDFTMNHVLGCSHGCLYPCYAYLMAKRFGKTANYEDWCKPKLVSNTLEILDKEVPRLKEKIESVQLCFTSDPFMCGYDEIGAMSISAIKKLNAAGIRCTVLTKGLLPIELSTQSDKNEYGITLISLDEEYRERVEPGAAPYTERVAALKALSDNGCKTWVSIEPYPTPNLIKQDLTTILNSVSFAKRIVFGRTNYSKEISAYADHKRFYNEQAEIVFRFCKEREINCHIKSGTITKN